MLCQEIVNKFIKKKPKNKKKKTDTQELANTSQQLQS